VDPKQYYYLFNTGYLFSTSEKIKLFPSTLLYFSPGNKFLFDLNASMNILDKLWVGASYRNGRSIAGFFQVDVNEQLRLAYTYNFNVGDLSSYSTGTYELMLRYEFRYKATDIVNPLDF
jgi:type IX secretion system PorP/SprF family membrane protein